MVIACKQVKSSSVQTMLDKTIWKGRIRTSGPLTYIGVLCADWHLDEWWCVVPHLNRTRSVLQLAAPHVSTAMSPLVSCWTKMLPDSWNYFEFSCKWIALTLDLAPLTVLLCYAFLGSLPSHQFVCLPVQLSVCVCCFFSALKPSFCPLAAFFWTRGCDFLQQNPG